MPRGLSNRFLYRFHRNRQKKKTFTNPASAERVKVSQWLAATGPDERDVLTMAAPAFQVQVLLPFGRKILLLTSRYTP